MKNLLTFIKTLASLLIIDLLYLAVLNGDYYRDYFKRFGGYSEHLKIYGFVAWFLIALGVHVFAVKSSTTSREALLKGMLLGLIVYGVYDFTNLATMKFFTFDFAIADVIWGTILCGTLSWISFNYFK